MDFERCIVTQSLHASYTLQYCKKQFKEEKKSFQEVMLELFKSCKEPLLFENFYIARRASFELAISENVSMSIKDLRLKNNIIFNGFAAFIKKNKNNWNLDIIMDYINKMLIKMSMCIGYDQAEKFSKLLLKLKIITDEYQRREIFLNVLIECDRRLQQMEEDEIISEKTKTNRLVSSVHSNLRDELTLKFEAATGEFETLELATHKLNSID